MTKNQKQRGQTIAEYGLLLALIAIVAVVAVMALGDSVSNKFDAASKCLSDKAACPKTPAANP